MWLPKRQFDHTSIKRVLLRRSRTLRTGSAVHVFRVSAEHLLLRILKLQQTANTGTGCNFVPCAYGSQNMVWTACVPILQELRDPFDPGLHLFVEATDGQFVSLPGGYYSRNNLDTLRCLPLPQHRRNHQRKQSAKARGVRKTHDN